MRIYHRFCSGSVLAVCVFWASVALGGVPTFRVYNCSGTYQQVAVVACVGGCGGTVVGEWSSASGVAAGGSVVIFTTWDQATMGHVTFCEITMDGGSCYSGMSIVTGNEDSQVWDFNPTVYGATNYQMSVTWTNNSSSVAVFGAAAFNGNMDFIGWMTAAGITPTNNPVAIMPGQSYYFAWTNLATGMDPYSWSVGDTMESSMVSGNNFTIIDHPTHTADDVHGGFTETPVVGDTGGGGVSHSSAGAGSAVVPATGNSGLNNPGSPNVATGADVNQAAASIVSALAGLDLDVSDLYDLTADQGGIASDFVTHQGLTNIIGILSAEHGLSLTEWSNRVAMGDYLLTNTADNLILSGQGMMNIDDFSPLGGSITNSMGEILSSLGSLRGTAGEGFGVVTVGTGDFAMTWNIADAVLGLGAIEDGESGDTFRSDVHHRANVRAMVWRPFIRNLVLWGWLATCIAFMYSTCRERLVQLMTVPQYTGSALAVGCFSDVPGVTISLRVAAGLAIVATVVFIPSIVGACISSMVYAGGYETVSGAMGVASGGTGSWLSHVPSSVVAVGSFIEVWFPFIEMTAIGVNLYIGEFVLDSATMIAMPVLKMIGV